MVELNENLGISGNTNAALERATGEYIALLDHDDTLAPFALFEVAKVIQSQPEVDVLYSDHDYLDRENGARCNPLFQARLVSVNHVLGELHHASHSAAPAVGGAGRVFRSGNRWRAGLGFVLARSRAHDRIAHIPAVLYHWRMHAGSTAHNDSAKDYAAQSQLTALRRHMERSGMDAVPEVMPNGLLHVHFRHPPTGKVSIVIPTKDRRDLLERCIATLLSVTTYSNFEILIVDNGSQESATHDYFSSLHNDSAHSHSRATRPVQLQQGQQSRGA